MARTDPKPIGDNLKKLTTAMKSSSTQLRAFREERLHAIRQYVGKHYGENGSDEKVPLNLIELAVNTYQRQIAARDPQVLCETPYRELLPGASDLQLAVNYLIRQIGLGKALNAVGVDALFGMGVLKVGLDFDTIASAEPGTIQDPGNVWVQPVPMDDWIMDMSARHYDEASYCGNRYKVPYDWAMGNQYFEKKARNKLKPSTLGEHPDEERGDDTDANVLSRGSSTQFEEYGENVDLWDIWLPREGLMLTFADGETTDPLRVIEWEGPAHGPYHILGFGYVPGNVMPLAPAHLWIDMHELVNRLFLKVGRQAERQKTILGVQASAAEDGKRVVNANDGEVIAVDDPGGMKEFRFGGADQQTQGMVVYLRDLFSYFAGNLDAIGGLAAQTQTVGQDRLLTASASQRVQDMQATMNAFVKGVVTDIAWYLWEDPLVKLPLTKRIPGTDLQIPFQWPVDKNGQDRRMGELFHYNFDIQPYSLMSRSPSERLSQLIPLVQNVIMPLTQMAGATIDVERFLKEVAELSGEPIIGNMVIYPNGEESPSRGPVRDDEGPGMPSATTRTYVRENRPAGTRQGKDQALAAHLMGLKQQPSEMAGLLRQG